MPPCRGGPDRPGGQAAAPLAGSDERVLCMTLRPSTPTVRHMTISWIGSTRCWLAEAATVGFEERDPGPRDRRETRQRPGVGVMIWAAAAPPRAPLSEQQGRRVGG